MPAKNAAADVVADGVLTVKEACDFLKVGKSEVFKLMGSGELRSLKIGKRRLIPKKAAVDLLAKKLATG